MSTLIGPRTHARAPTSLWRFVGPCRQRITVIGSNWVMNVSIAYDGRFSCVLSLKFGYFEAIHTSTVARENVTCPGDYLGYHGMPHLMGVFSIATDG